jgi:hypothetical protein
MECHKLSSPLPDRQLYARIPPLRYARPPIYQFFMNAMGGYAYKGENNAMIVTDATEHL